VIATDQILDEKSGATRAVPGAWTGELKAPVLEVNVAGNLKILDEGVRIRGQVVNSAGKPVQGALVTVWHRVGTFGSFEGFVTLELAHEVTDGDGKFEFFRLPAESPSFELRVQHRDLPPKREAVANNAPAGKKRRYEAKVALDAGRSVRGRVVDA